MKKTIVGMAALAAAATGTLLANKPIQAQCGTTGGWYDVGNPGSGCDCSISSSQPCYCCQPPAPPPDDEY